MTDPKTHPEIIPQHYPMWVHEWRPGPGDGHHRFLPIIGWVWLEGPYLHPVVIADTGALPYERDDGDQSWGIVDQRFMDEYDQEGERS